MKSNQMKHNFIHTLLVIACVMLLMLHCTVCRGAAGPLDSNEDHIEVSPCDSDMDPFEGEEDGFLSDTDEDSLQVENPSSFDPDDDPLKEENILPFDPDSELLKGEVLSSFDRDVDSNEKGYKYPVSDIMEELLKDSRFTLGYELSLGTASGPEVITNNFYVRQETQALFLNNLFFKFDGRVLLLSGNDHRAEAEDRDVAVEEHLREFYIQAGFERFSIRLGKQIVVWGKADTAVITDVVSPRDNSDFIFIKLEDSRLGQMMLSTDIYTSCGNLFFFLSPEPLTDREPDRDTRYYREFLERDAFTVNTEELSFSHVEYGARWEKTFGKTDLSLMAGRFFSNGAVYDFSGSLDSSSGKQLINETFIPYKMAGMAASHAKGNYLLKVESAFKKDFALQGVDGLQRYVPEKKDLFDISLGTEYNANEKYRLSLELSHRYIPGGMAHIPLYDKNSTACYFTFVKDFLNQTLTFEYMFFHHIQEQNAFHHFRLTRDVTDNFQVMGSWAFFNIQDNSSTLWPYKEEDRFTMEMKYYF